MSDGPSDWERAPDTFREKCVLLFALISVIISPLSVQSYSFI